MFGKSDEISPDSAKSLVKDRLEMGPTVKNLISGRHYILAY
jgi:hypothetical protein